MKRVTFEYQSVQKMLWITAQIPLSSTRHPFFLASGHVCCWYFTDESLPNNATSQRELPCKSLGPLSAGNSVGMESYKVLPQHQCGVPLPTHSSCGIDCSLWCSCTIVPIFLYTQLYFSHSQLLMSAFSNKSQAKQSASQSLFPGKPHM